MMQKRLRLITAMVAEGNRCTVQARRLLQQKILPRQTPRLFQADLLLRRQRRDIDPGAHQWDLQLGAESADKIEIVTTLRTDSVIKVGGEKSELPGGGDRTEKMEEGDRIAAAGEGNQDPFLRLKQSVSLESLPKIVDKPEGCHQRRQAKNPLWGEGVPKWWRCRDSNSGHCGYEPHALTN